MSAYFTVTNSLTDDTADIDGINAKAVRELTSVFETQAGQIEHLINRIEQATGRTVTITIQAGTLTIADA